VLVAGDGETALSQARLERPDLVILDQVLPGMDGLLVCRYLREETHIPILMLSVRDREVDKVLGFDLGADDYMTKPFSVLELLARVKARLWRSRVAAAGTGEMTPEVLREGDLQVDLMSHKASKADKILNLAPKEFDLLAFLMRHPGQAFTKEQLLKGGLAIRRSRGDSDRGRPRRVA
jgi:DNA-binding response OmpR family regulator